MVPRLTISVAVHNLWEMTSRCVDSILRYTEEPFDLVITDNASAEDTRRYLTGLARKHQNVRVVRNEKNLGFSLPHNIVFSSCESDYFLVLNNDVTLCGGWFEAMLKKFEQDEELAICGVANACIALDDAGLGGPGDEAEYIEGSCLLVRTDLIRGLDGGLFDPAYKFAYYEDSDLGLRARRAGLKIAVVDIPVLHLGAQTSKTIRDVDLEGYGIRNKHIFLSRWSSYLKERKRKPVTKDRIVVRRAGAQGDVIMATPILRALRRDYPNATIVMETICKDVLQGNPDVNEIFLQMKPKETDHVIDLNMAYEKSPMKHAVAAYADVAAVEFNGLEDWRPRLYPHDTARVVASQRMPSGDRYAIIHPGSIDGWVGRQWPYKRWPDVIANLHKRGYKTILVGNDATQGVGTSLDFRNVHFSHFAALMERASLFVGLDSMPFHVAQAFSIPTVAIFGSVDPGLRIIPGAPVIPVTAARCGCLGCHNWLPAPRTVTNSCLRGREMCMDLIQPENMISAIDEVEKAFCDRVGGVE
jgi:GT2 family glycosyltransferase/ADP-heptose:LPS heptosyltransferase